MAKYGEWTKGYRLSSNIEDRRFDRTSQKGSSTNQMVDDYSRPTGARRGNRSTPDENTPDDYSNAADGTFGGMKAGDTPDRKAGQARKTDPADAIDITSNRR